MNKSVKVDAVVHTYTRNGVTLVTPKRIVARLRDDFAQPTVVGETFMLDGKLQVLWY
jgi:hypothetical protein